MPFVEAGCAGAPGAEGHPEQGPNSLHARGLQRLDDFVERSLRILAQMDAKQAAFDAWLAEQTTFGQQLAQNEASPATQLARADAKPVIGAR